MSPFLSKSQARWGNSVPGQQALKSKLREFNKATDFEHLPEHVAKKKTKDSIIKKLTKNRKKK